MLHNAFSLSVYQLVPKPKTAYLKDLTYAINPQLTKIYFPQNSDTQTKLAVDYLKKLLKEYSGFDFESDDLSNNQGNNAIIMGELNSSPEFNKIIAETANPGEMNLMPEGYILDVSITRITIAGGSGKGVFNAVSTLAQLLTPGDFSLFVEGGHVWDYPEYSDRWAIAFHNLLVNSNLTALQNILDTMAYRKLNGLNHTDFKYNILDMMQPNYFENVKKFKTLCDERNVEIIPGVMNFGWSSGILYKNPNLAEGLPTIARYYVEGDTARIIPDPNVTLPNGEFENVDPNGKFTGWGFYDEAFATQDKSVFYSGNASAKCTNFDGTNSRFSRAVNCQQYRGYVLSAWVKTENFSGGEVRLFAYGNEGSEWRALSFTNLDIPSTSNKWLNVQVYFNTLYFKKVNLYCGVWGAGKGTIWWDKFEIFDLGLTNILRRSGTPLNVSNLSKNNYLNEGIDFDTLTDKIMLSKRGEYGPYHQPPTFKIKSSSNVQNGDTLMISSYHPFTAVSDNQISGSTMVCVSEDTVYKIVEDQSVRLNNMLEPQRFFMSHDEIRNLNWDKACWDRDLSAASLLGDNITKCYDILRKIKPGSEILMWSDMVDSLHNAHKDYYLIRGDLTGIWTQIPKDIVICNWNGGKARQSLDFFSKLGFSQISSPYYDDGSTNNIRKWRLAQIGIPNFRGMNYTTWANDYSQLTPFSYYAWGGGPTIYFQPFDSTVFNMRSIGINAKILKDLYDPNDSIFKALFIVEWTNNSLLQTDTFMMERTSPDDFYYHWQTIGKKTFRYKIWAVNAQGIERETPFYIADAGEINPVVERKIMEENFSFSINPNPADELINISFNVPISQKIRISICDLLGRELSLLKNDFFDYGQYNFSYDVSKLNPGLYILKFESPAILIERKIIKK